MATFTECKLTIYDDFTTPKFVFEEIKNFIPKDKTIWMPFYCDGKAGKHMRELGFNVIHKNEDFFETNHENTVIVDNPPFNLKKQIIQTCIDRGTPFMLIVPISTLCYKYTRMLDKSLQIIIPYNRPRFIRTNKETGDFDPDWRKKTSPFECVWLCYKMHLPNDINFI